MTEPVLLGIMALSGVLGAALFSVVGVILGLVWRRLAVAEATNNGLWFYNRTLIDAYFHRVKEPPPAPPSYIAHLYQTGQ